MFNQLQKSISYYSSRNCNAFFINGIFYNYLSLAQVISKIRKALRERTIESDKVIGLIANDDLETYASIIALWFEGKAYLPLSTETPLERNQNILEQAEVMTIIDSSESSKFSDFNLIASKKLADTALDLDTRPFSENDFAYLLFTSGTTGNPKGVPITRGNLSHFAEAFEAFQFDINETDRCLQMFELTFDLSVMSYLIPLLRGACVYTIPKNKIKYSYIFELLTEKDITVALMVPSMLHYLRPYFNEIYQPQMKYSLFCGEALPADVAEEWYACLPNATIVNVYGPTENTIFCTHYTVNRNGQNKTHNGILSIGRSMVGTRTVIINDSNEVLPAGNVGQLCLGGDQLTPGYLNNEAKNRESFFTLDENERALRFYKTGDLCFSDEEGDILYVGRLDHQVKIQGFRVELSEIDYHAKSFLGNVNAVSVAIADAIGNTEIGLVIESKKFDTLMLYNHMKAKIPGYMIPKRIEFVENFALNTNGKIDRNKLRQLFN